MIKKRTKNYWENMKRIEITAMQYNLKKYRHDGRKNLNI